MKSKPAIMNPAYILVCLAVLALGSVAMAAPQTHMAAYIDGELLLEHTFDSVAHLPGRIMFVPYNGIVRFDDVKVTATDGRELFNDDFEGETIGQFPSRWQQENAGGWVIVDEDGNKVLEQSDAVFTGMSDLWPLASEFANSGEHTLEFKYKLVAWTGSTWRMNFFARADNRNNGYMLQYVRTDEVMTLAHRSGGGDNREATAPFVLEPDTWYDIKIIISVID